MERNHYSGIDLQSKVLVKQYFGCKRLVEIVKEEYQETKLFPRLRLEIRGPYGTAIVKFISISLRPTLVQSTE